MDNSTIAVRCYYSRCTQQCIMRYKQFMVNLLSCQPKTTWSRYEEPTHAQEHRFKLEEEPVIPGFFITFFLPESNNHLKVTRTVILILHYLSSFQILASLQHIEVMMKGKTIQMNVAGLKGQERRTATERSKVSVSKVSPKCQPSI